MSDQNPAHTNTSFDTHNNYSVVVELSERLPNCNGCANVLDYHWSQVLRMRSYANAVCSGCCEVEARFNTGANNTLNSSFRIKDPRD